MSNGTTRIGDYRVERELRSDDTGVIYEAVHLVLPRRAAVKVAHARANAVQLMREACVLEALAHPGVPRVYECGVLPDKRPWVARELVDGTQVADLVAQSPMPMADVVVMIRSVAEILEHAHARGVVHDRISDAAVVRTPDRPFAYCVRGWAAVVVHDSEQAAAAPTNDIYALGALAFRALTGTEVLPGSPEAFAQEQAPSAPAELTALIDQMLAGDPRWRPNATEVRERAAWLAQTLELVPHARPRWTPVHGIGERQSTEAEPVADTFKVRIHS